MIKNSGFQPVVPVPLMVRKQPVGGTQKPYVKNLFSTF